MFNASGIAKDRLMESRQSLIQNFSGVIERAAFPALNLPPGYRGLFKFP